MQGATNDLELLRIRLPMQAMLEDLSSLRTNACLAENINVHFCCLANHDQSWKIDLDSRRRQYMAVQTAHQPPPAPLNPFQLVVVVHNVLVM